jgi:hypothetical protein
MPAIDPVSVATFALAGAFGGLILGALLDPELRLPAWRRTMLAVARRHLAQGTPYQWGGGRSPNDCGLDCSGLVIVALKEAGVQLPPEGQTSGVWCDVLPVVTDPQPGDLAFFGPNGKAVHVVIVEKPLANGDAVTIGANGGDRDMTCAQAVASGAKVTRKLVSDFKFAPFLGYRTIDPAARAGGVGRYDVRRPVLCCG